MADSLTRDAASTHGANLCLNCSPQAHRDPQTPALSPSNPQQQSKPVVPAPNRSRQQAGSVQGTVRQVDEADGQAHLGIHAVPIT